MKKSALSLILVFAMALSASAQAPQPKPEELMKNVVQVEKTQPVPEKMKTGFDLITAKDSLALLTYISSDLLEGRETATRGAQLAAEYAVSLFALWKVLPAGDTPRPAFSGMRRSDMPAAPLARGYLQEFAMKEISDVSTELAVQVRQGDSMKSRAFRSGVDFMSMSSTPESFTAPVIFAGYGITEKEIGYDDLKGLDVKGKIVLILTEAPGKDDPKSPFQKKELKEKYFPPAGPFAFRMDGGFNKAQEIAKLGASAVLQVQASANDADLYKGLATPRRQSDDRPIINEPRRRLLIPGAGQRMPWESSPIITITREIANFLLENSGRKIEDLKARIDSTYKPASLVLPGTTVTLSTTAKTALVRCRNVVGYIEGSDPVLKNEYVVVGAHYDHLGKRGDYVFNGADDNGSGSVGVMNLARAFAAAPQKPKRTIVFALWTGEEEGLLGSRYYVQNPAFPLDKTAAYINLDMISRPYDEKSITRMTRMFNFPAGEELFKKIKPANFLPVSFAAGAGLSDVFRDADQYVGLDLFLRESGSNDRGSGGSDHSSFGAAKVPWAFCIANMTEDYHQTSDSVEKTSGDLIEKISKLVYVSAYKLADK
jgi:hypothetical protein